MKKGFINFVASGLILGGGLSAIAALLPLISTPPVRSQADEDTNIRVYKLVSPA